MGCAELQEEPLVRPAPQPPNSTRSAPFRPLLRKAPKDKSYTFRERNVYVSRPKRIRFARDTYTLHSE